MSSTMTCTRIGLPASLASARPIWSATEVRPDAEAKLSGARVNFSSRSCVIAVGGFEMNPLLTLYFSGGMSFAGLGLLKLQARLERWAYERHVED
jgi:hypothetical protein